MTLAPVHPDDYPTILTWLTAPGRLVQSRHAGAVPTLERQYQYVASLPMGARYLRIHDDGQFVGVATLMPTWYGFDIGLLIGTPNQGTGTRALRAIMDEHQTVRITVGCAASHGAMRRVCEKAGLAPLDSEPIVRYGREGR